MWKSKRKEETEFKGWGPVGFERKRAEMSREERKVRVKCKGWMEETLKRKKEERRYQSAPQRRMRAD